MTYTVGRHRRISKRVQNIQEEEDARFWKQTWPELKSNGWSHDDKCGAFYPPEAQKVHAAKRRRLGSDHKNFFKDINELKTYLSSNPFLYVANNEGTVVVNGSGNLNFPYEKESGKVAPSSSSINDTTTTTTITSSELVAPTTDSAEATFNSPQKCSKRENKPFSRSPSSVAAPTAMESTMEFISQNKRLMMGQKDCLLVNSGPSVLSLPPNASLNLDALPNNKLRGADFDVRSVEKLTEGKKAKKYVKSLKFRGPGRPKGSKNINDHSKTKKLIKARQKPKQKQKRQRRRNKSKNFSYDENGDRIYVCDRCGRNDFMNGHALGGHKKYCQKPEYDLAREKHAMAETRKRQRSDDPTMRRSKKGSKHCKGKSLLNLNDITTSIRKFADNVDLSVFENPFMDNNINFGDKLSLYGTDDNLNILDQFVNTNDLFELEVVQHVLREEKARLAGRIAGLNTNSEQSILAFDYMEKENGVYSDDEQQLEDEKNSDKDTQLWHDVDPTMKLQRIKSFDIAGEAAEGDINTGGSEMVANCQNDGLAVSRNSENIINNNINPIQIEQEEKNDRDDDIFFACNDVLFKNRINLNPSRQPSFLMNGDEEKLEFELGGDIAMQLGF